MSINAEQKNNNTEAQTTPAAAPQVVLVPAPYYQANAGTPSAPQYYLPQTTQFVPLPETTPVSQGQCGDQSGCRLKGWCRWRGQQGGCCNYVDPRPIGDFSHFLGGLAVGTFLPIVGPTIVRAMETSQLAGLGSFYGTVDFLFLISLLALHNGHMNHVFFIVGGVLLFLSVIFTLVGFRKTCRVMKAYETAVAKDPSIALPVISEEGKRCQRCVSVVLSLFFPIIATIPRVIFSRSLNSRFGSVKGLGWAFLILGAIFFPPLAVLGLYLIQIANIHFRRALISASTKNTGAGAA